MTTSLAPSHSLTRPLSLSLSVPLLIWYNWWHYYQRKTNIHKIVRFSSTLFSRHARLARVSICFSSVKFVSIFSNFMRFLLKQWQRWWYGLRSLSPLSSAICSSLREFVMLLTSRPIKHWLYIHIFVYSQPIYATHIVYVYFEYSFSVLLWFICSCSCSSRNTHPDLSPLAPVAGFTICNWC